MRAFFRRAAACAAAAGAVGVGAVAAKLHSTVRSLEEETLPVLFKYNAFSVPYAVLPREWGQHQSVDAMREGAVFAADVLQKLSLSEVCKDPTRAPVETVIPVAYSRAAVWALCRSHICLARAAGGGAPPAEDPRLGFVAVTRRNGTRIRVALKPSASVAESVVAVESNGDEAEAAAAAENLIRAVYGTGFGDKLALKGVRSVQFRMRVSPATRSVFSGTMPGVSSSFMTTSFVSHDTWLVHVMRNGAARHCLAVYQHLAPWNFLPAWVVEAACRAWAPGALDRTKALAGALMQPTGYTMPREGEEGGVVVVLTDGRDFDARCVAPFARRYMGVDALCDADRTDACLSWAIGPGEERGSVSRGPGGLIERRNDLLVALTPHGVREVVAGRGPVFAVDAKED